MWEIKSASHNTSSLSVKSYLVISHSQLLLPVTGLLEIWEKKPQNTSTDCSESYSVYWRLIRTFISQRFTEKQKLPFWRRMFSAEAFSDVLVIAGCTVLMMLPEFMTALPKTSQFMNVFCCLLQHILFVLATPWCLSSKLCMKSNFTLQNVCQYSYDYRSLLWTCTLRISVSSGKVETHHSITNTRVPSVSGCLALLAISQLARLETVERLHFSVILH